MLYHANLGARYLYLDPKFISCEDGLKQGGPDFKRLL